MALIPEHFRSRSYFEPFFGAGSLFFSLRPEMAALSDLNEHLISTYIHVKSSPATIARYLRAHRVANTESHYYEVRDTYNRSSPSAAQAARFIYLNATCFNGVFRVNTRGAFNVPVGDKASPFLPSAKTLKAASTCLSAATIKCTPYSEALSSASQGAFVYLDPPYPPLNGTSYFTHYTTPRFGHQDHDELAALVDDIDKRGCYFMMTNADTPRIRELYRRFNQSRLTVTRYVTCKQIRHKVGELVISNFDPPTEVSHSCAAEVAQDAR